MLYGCDGRWWKARNGVPEFKGLKISPDAESCVAFPDLHKVSILEHSNAINIKDAGALGDGGNSGFQAFNLAVQFGAKRIILVGFDLRLDKGIHWHGLHGRGLSNPTDRTLGRWRAAFNESAKTTADLGIEVINVSEESALTAYPIMRLDDALSFLSDEPARTVHQSPPLYINIPAWGDFYVDLACQYTIPAVLASLKESNFKDVTFLINCKNNEQDRYKQTIGEHKIEFPGVQNTPALANGGRVPRLHDDHWRAFKDAHRGAIARTPRGAIVALLNSDIVCSKETFAYVDAEMAKGKKVVASVGIRTSDEDRTSEPPIGASADELFNWIWGNLHHISKECIWNGGRSKHPTILYFEDDEGVSLRCFHLTPMFIKKDNRLLLFKGTIDDDLLGRFPDEEVAYPLNGEIAFAEISPNIKKHDFGQPLTAQHVLDFWEKRNRTGQGIKRHYIRNFKQRLRVLGNPTKSHPAADEIIARLDA